ncbi:hypothetical protein X975_18502, partial [Stegodyphus mimosarum]
MSDVQKDTELSPTYSSSFSKNHNLVRNEEPKNNRQSSRPPPRPPPSQPFYPGTRKVIQKQPNSVIQSQQPEYSKPTTREPPAELSLSHSDTELLYQQKEKPVKKKTANKMRKSTLNKSACKPQGRLMKNPEESKRNCCCICWVNLCYELCTQG